MSRTNKPAAPFVSQGMLSKSDAEQGRCFREAADSFKNRALSIKPGKGDTRRHRAISDEEFDSNWNSIDWKPKKKKRFPRDFREHEDSTTAP